MDSLTDTRPISRLEIVDTGRRRRWSAAAKLRIVEESLSGPVIARRGTGVRRFSSGRASRSEGALDVSGLTGLTWKRKRPRTGGPLEGWNVSLLCGAA